MHSLKTFLIEDSPVIRQNLISTLEDLTAVTVMGFAEDEVGAVRALSDRSRIIDLVILDVVLREGTGLGVLRRAEVKRADRIFVVLSNYATAEVRTRALSLGATHVFDKSREIDALLDFCGSLSSSLAMHEERQGGAA